MENIKVLSKHFLIDHKVKKLQLDYDDLVTISKDMGYEVYTYTHAKPLIERLELSSFTTRAAFSVSVSDCHVILYSGSLPYAERLFAIAHEIGHIQLQHSGDSILGHSANRRREKAQEDEANTFAYGILAPTPILRRCHANTVRTLKRLTLLNDRRAEQIMNELRSYKADPLDDELISQYRKFIESYNRKPIIVLATVAIIFVFMIITISPWRLFKTLPVDAPLPVVTSPTSPPSALEPISENYVYITPKGSKYHRSDCYHISENVIEVPVEDAQKTGYTPCKDCRPDDLDIE